MSESNSNPFITFCYSCFNVADYLDMSLNSLLNQKVTFGDAATVANNKEFEILLIEDCSTDNGQTLSKCRLFEENYTNIKLIRQESNSGLSASRNLGINNSHGKYITFPDPDDSFPENSLQEFLNEACKGFDYVVGGVNELHCNKGKVTQTVKIVPDKKSCDNHEQVVEISKYLERKILFGYAWNKLYKKEIIDNNELRFEVGTLFIEDVLFNIEFSKVSSSVSCIATPMMNYYRRLDNKRSVTSKYEPRYFELHYRRIKSFYDWYNSEGQLDSNAKKILANLYFRYALSAIWRNSCKASKLSKKDQRNRIDLFFDMPLTKELMNFLEPEGLLSKISASLFKKKNKELLLVEAKIINFVTNNMAGLLTRIRQKR